MGFQRNFLLVFAVRLVQFVLCNEDEGPIFQTSLGKIQGTIMTSDGGIEFYAFRGIPFAKSPVKVLRFKEPEALTEPWAGVLDATEDGAICIQFNLFEKQLTGDEDCLYLNVYTPKTFEDLLPVMVWIHGGGFFFGTGASSLYGPQRMMNKTGVILVTINYRLGPFGFLTTLDENSPGNYGMLDQVMALKWVRDNIAAFGGDPDRVTIFGESAGGGSVGLHLLSPLSKGLFDAAIAQSGSALADWVTEWDNSKSLNSATNLASRLKCSTKDHEVMIRCLKRLPSLDIVVKAADQIKEAIQIDCKFTVFKPVVDTSRGSKAFLPDHPHKLLSMNPPNAASIITGVTKDEGISFLDVCAERHGGISSFPKSKLPMVLRLNFPSSFQNEGQLKRISHEIIARYFRNVDETDSVKRTAALTDFFSDSIMNFKVDVFNELITKYEWPVYVYKFTYRGKHSMNENAPNDMVAHADELQYLFRTACFKSMTLSEADTLMSDIMLTLWTTFAITKAPSLKDSLSEEPGFKWEPMTSNNPVYLDLNLNPAMVEGHLSVDYDLWKNASTGHRKDEL